jgi:hypothetical protein
LVNAMLKVGESIVNNGTTLVARDELRGREQAIENVARSSFRGGSGTSLAIDNEP